MPKKVLVVDDEPDLEILVRQNFRRKIRAGEMEFVFAQNGKIALERLAENTDIDVVMSDINMPEMDGLTLLNEIIKNYPLLRSVIVSAYGDMKNLRTAMNNGAYDFVTKPIDFEDLEKTLLKTISEVDALREANAIRDQLVTVRRELQIGREIQRSFLPTIIPAVSGYEFAASFQPAKECAGDFYDIFPMSDETKICFVLGDVCGKGVGSALFMTLVRSLIHAYAIMQEASVNAAYEIIQMTHDYITTIHEEANMFATVFFGILDTTTGIVQYINCGHNAPVVYAQDGSLIELPHSGPIIGIFPSKDFIVREFTLQPGELLFVYSDGATDCINPAQDIFGEETLFQFVKDNKNGHGQEIVQGVLNKIAEFIDGAEQFDDITLLTIKRT
ncbi:MAG: SpoIIE family protein phosphatase [Ignavibacteria bacterium]|nr:SpoIIE family protein phosphatase [Ignavibacteria bacterium]